METPKFKRRAQRQPSSDQLPPNSAEAEKGVLGCCLQDAEAIESIQDRIKRWGPVVFYDLRHQKLWAALLELRTQAKPVDLITVAQALRDANELEACGGLSYLNELVEETPSAANWSYYLGIVEEKFLLRRVLAQCVETVGRVREGGESVSDLVNRFQKEAVELVEEHTTSQIVPQPERAQRLIDTLEKRHRGKQEITGLETPFWYLNNMTAGLQPQELVVVAARPSTGKTALGVDLAIHALRKGVPVLFFSAEMSADQIDLRMYGNIARINGMKLRNGFWKETAEERMAEAIAEFASWPFYLDDRAAITGQDVLLTTRRLKRQASIGLVVVDYIQIMRGITRYEQRHEELSEVSRFLKQTAKECNVPVVVLAQLNRDAEKDRGGRRPLLSDVKDCGAIEQDADLVGLLWEPKIDEDDPDDMKWLKHHKPDDPKDDETEWRHWFRRINLTIAKNRNGPTGDCELVFQRSTARFVDAHSPSRVKETLL